jgi:acetylglutamate kinase
MRGEWPMVTSVDEVRTRSVGHDPEATTGNPTTTGTATEPPRRRAVLKLGGEVVADTRTRRRLLDEVRELVDDAWHLVIVHGGGPQASALQARLGLIPNKVAGQRVTDEHTLTVMKQTVAGAVNVDLVAAALDAGIDAIGLCGVGGRLVEARRRPPVQVSGSATPVDYGLVGDVVAIRTELVEMLWSAGHTPVVSPLGISTRAAGPSEVFNINADTVASRIAAALGCHHLFLVTSVPGVLRDVADPSTRIARLTPREVERAVAEGVITGGMIPKVQEAVAHLRLGVGAVHILGTEPGTLGAAAGAPGSRGTVIAAESGPASLRPSASLDRAHDSTRPPSLRDP